MHPYYPNIINYLYLCFESHSSNACLSFVSVEKIVSNMGCGASTDGPPGFNQPCNNDKVPLVAAQHYSQPHPVETREIQTSMSDFKHLLDALPAPAPAPVSKSIPSKDPSKDGVDVEDVWVQVEGTCQPNPNLNLVVKRSGWKTVRIFVSSTFKDFHHEREVLVKEVRDPIFRYKIHNTR